MSKVDFDKAAQDAKANCPVSKAYNLEISLEAELAA
jgi:organic hydroperoxide reductase OsmC/OhrA